MFLKFIYILKNTLIGQYLTEYYQDYSTVLIKYIS